MRGGLSSGSSSKASRMPAGPLISYDSMRRAKLVPVVVAIVVVIAIVVAAAAVFVPMMVVVAAAGIAIPIAVEVLAAIVMRRHPTGAPIGRSCPVAVVPLIVVPDRIPVAFHPHVIGGRS